MTKQAKLTESRLGRLQQETGDPRETFPEMEGGVKVAVPRPRGATCQVEQPVHSCPGQGRLTDVFKEMGWQEPGGRGRATAVVDE